MAKIYNLNDYIINNTSNVLKTGKKSYKLIKDYPNNKSAKKDKYFITDNKLANDIIVEKDDNIIETISYELNFLNKEENTIQNSNKEYVMQYRWQY